MKRSLVVGAGGQIGGHCVAALGDRAVGTVWSAAAKPPLSNAVASAAAFQSGGSATALQTILDIRDAAAFQRVAGEVRPDVIYLCACAADVEFCETNPDEAWQTNVRGVRNAVDAANRCGAKLVYLSSEYVFDGASGPYREDDPVNPLSVYGTQKLAAEHAVALFANDCLIVRTTVVFSIEAQQKNFVYRLVNTLRDGRTIRVPVDQISSPTYAPDLVAAMIELASRGERGLFHIAGPRVVNRYEFACAAARIFALDESLIVPVTTAELQQKARRPLRAGLVVKKAERALCRPLLDFEAGLREMRDAIH